MKRQVNSRLRDEDQNAVINWPEDFDIKATSIPFEDGCDTSTSVENKVSRNTETWITVSACLTQPLHVRLSKSVYHQLLRTLDNLSYNVENDQGDSVSDSRNSNSDPIYSGVSLLPYLDTHRLCNCLHLIVGPSSGFIHSPFKSEPSNLKVQRFHFLNSYKVLLPIRALFSPIQCFWFKICRFSIYRRFSFSFSR